MELQFSPEDTQFREEVRRFLRDSLPQELAQREAQGFHLPRSALSAWQSTLYRKGWAAPHWPTAHGGTGWTPVRRFVYEMEYGLANAPEFSVIAISLVGPVLARFGSPSLKDEFLDPMLRGDVWFCQGFSEPGAGSDLANLKTQAVRDGDHYVITGQKTWTTVAHEADFMICLARTRTDGKPQAGLSMLIVPMDAQGVTVRPIETLDGGHTINEVFLDGVRVPARHLVGEEHSGWQQAKFLLSNERTYNAHIGLLKRYLARIPDRIAQGLAEGLSSADAEELRRRHAELDINVTALEWSVLRTLVGEDSTVATAAASGLKVRGSEYLIGVSDLENAILGPQVIPRFTPQSEQAGLAGAGAHAPGRTAQYLYWRASSIFGGSNEIQRNIIWNAISRA